MSKKGISAVVTTVLIILISIIAVVILWAALKPTLQSTSGRGGSAISCSEVLLDLDSCVYAGSSINVTVSRSGGGTANDLNVTVAVSDDDSSVSTSNVVSALGSRKYNFNSASTTSGVVSAQAAVILADGTICNPVKKTCTQA